MDAQTTTALASGFAPGDGLIFSIRPQNHQLTRAGPERRHGGAVATDGYLPEIAIVFAGVAGLGVALAGAPGAAAAAQALGVVFLVVCGVAALARSPGAPDPSYGPAGRSRREALVTILAAHWLNPLVYVEVLLLVGGLLNGYDETARPAFAACFLAASEVRFHGWTLAGRRAVPLLSEPNRRVAFDRASCALLLGAAGLLALHLAA